MAAGIRLAGGSVLAIALLLISAAGASASSGHRYWTSFGGGLIDDLAFVAVDDSNGPSAHDVYVADAFDNRVLKFSPEGEFILMFGDEVDATTGGDVCTAASGDQCKTGVPVPVTIPEDQPSPGFSYASDLAVDGSAGTTAGDVYVVDRGTHRVLRFDPDGHRDTLWADEGELRTPGAAGVAVDAAGRLLVLDLADENPLVRTFDPNGGELGSVAVAWGAFPIDLEVDGAGDLYVPVADDEVAEFSPAGSLLRGFTVGAGSLTGFAVEGASGTVFLSRGEGVGSYLAGCFGNPCSAAEKFGEGYVGWAGDLAIDEADQTLYAIDYRDGAASVAVFLPASQIPEVTTGTASVSDQFTADLHGAIDPVGGPPAVSCRFEYEGPAVDSSVPCAQPTPISSEEDVTAHVVGLERGASYRFRLVAKTAARTVVGQYEEFRTPEFPGAQTGPVLTVDPEGALLSGSVESPAGVPITGCHFQVVAYMDYLRSDFDRARIFPCDPEPFYEAERDISVTSRANFLQPGTPYRYRVSVVNTDATVNGTPQAFTTLPLSRDREPERRIERPRSHHRRPHRPSRRVPCTKKACTVLLEGAPRARVWVSPRFPASYGWLFEIAVDGHPVHHTALEKGCRSTFAGHGLIAKLNACHGRFRVVYRGLGSIRFRWRVFANCRCAEVAGGAPGP